MMLGCNAEKAIDAIFVNSPLKDYDKYPRRNDFTLPVLGLAYIATYAELQGWNVGVLDAEASGMGVSRVAGLINEISPRWVGMNLLAPTYENSVAILSLLKDDIAVMLGGHQAKAMPVEIVEDLRLPRVDALVLGEGELICSSLLDDVGNRTWLPGVWWRDERGRARRSEPPTQLLTSTWTAPDIDKLPFVNRQFLAQDPGMTKCGRLESNLVGSRGCPYECAFCGAARSANPDISVRTRSPSNIISEMEELYERFGVTAFRFVDDLFLASPGFMKKSLSEFIRRGIGERFVWDATGRINTLSRVDESVLNLMKEAGCREVALGVESGSSRILDYMGKRITPQMTSDAVRRLLERGIGVKGYIILGYPTETEAELAETVKLVEMLWAMADRLPGDFRCSAFEFRPYPGTPEWHRLILGGNYSASQLLNYSHIDLTSAESEKYINERDEFNFSVNIQFGEASLSVVRENLQNLTSRQKERRDVISAHVV